jgi:hypothetical protein
MFFHLYIDGDLNFMQFHYCLLAHQSPSKYYTICIGSNLTVFDGPSNDNEMTWNLNHHQSISTRIYL